MEYTSHTVEGIKVREREVLDRLEKLSVLSIGAVLLIVEFTDTSQRIITSMRTLVAEITLGSRCGKDVSPEDAKARKVKGERTNAIRAKTAGGGIGHEASEG